MTPEEALQILADATEPGMSGKITRSGYALIEEALKTIKNAISKKEQE